MSYVKGGSVVADPATTGASTWPAPPTSAPGDFSTGNNIEAASTNQWGAWTPFCTVGARGTTFDRQQNTGGPTTAFTVWANNGAVGSVRVTCICRSVSTGSTPTGWTRILHDNWNGAHYMDVYWRLCDGTNNDQFHATQGNSLYAFIAREFPLVSGEAASISTGAAFAATATFDPDTVTRIGKFFSFYLAVTNVNTTLSSNPAGYVLDSGGASSTANFSMASAVKTNVPADTAVFAQQTDNPGTGTFGAVGTGKAWTVAIPASNIVAAETLAVGAWSTDSGANNTLWQIGAGEPGAQVVRGTYVQRNSSLGMAAPMEIAAKFAAGEKVWVRISATSTRTMAMQVMPTANIG